jgi:DNA-binding SARP family transcriptional activator/tetratricopeptide (TPR) repeat protein
VRFGLLGPLTVESGGEPRSVRSVKQRIILGLLLLEPGRVVSTDRLLDALWPDEPPRTGKKSLHVHVYQLRRFLAGPAPAEPNPVGPSLAGPNPAESRPAEPDLGRLVAVPHGYALRVEDGERDLDEFAGLVAAARQAMAGGDPVRAAALYRAGLGLWRGEALADLTDHGGDFAAFAARAAADRTAAIEERVDADLACGRHTEVVSELTALTADQPLRERPRGQLMLALDRSGRKAEALAVYADARRLLRTELGVDPGAALNRVHQAVLRGETELPPEAAPSPSQLPRDVGDFTGQQAALAALLAGPPGSVVAIVGPPGIGKTALAVHAAYRLAPQFPDGTLFTDLQGADGRPRPPRDVLAGFLRALRVPAEAIPADLQEAAALYRSATAGLRALVVLDNAAGEAQVRPLLPAGLGCRTLVTSRRQLAGLEGAGRLTVDALPAADAAGLLARLLGQARAAADPDALAAIAARCGGLPLAIRIAGARLAVRPAWTLAEFAGRLSREQDRLGELAAGDLAVRGAFALSYAALDPRARLAFRRLGLAGPMTAGPELAACLSGLPVPAAEAALAELAEASMVEPAGRAGRYRCHDLLRLFAAEQARADDRPDDAAAALTGLLSYLLHATAAADVVLTPHRTRIDVSWCEPPVPPPGFAGPADAIAWCEDELANLVSAAALAHARGLYRFAWQLPGALWGFFTEVRCWAEWQAADELALDAARRLGDRAAEALILSNLGNVYQDLDRLPEALANFEAALTVRRELGDLAAQGSVLNNMAGALGRLGRPAEAVDCLEQALVIRRGLGRPAQVGNTLVNLGDAYHMVGRLDEAVRCLDEALEIHEALGGISARAAARVNRADTLIDLARYEAAQADLDAAAGLFAGIGNQYGVAYVVHHRGRIHLAEGRPAAAVDCFEEALAVRRAIGDPRGQAETLDLLARAHHEAGRLPRARACWLQALCVYTDLRLPAAEAIRSRLETLEPS